MYINIFILSLHVLLVNSVYQMQKIGIAFYVLKFILDIGPEHGH